MTKFARCALANPLLGKVEQNPPFITSCKKVDPNHRITYLRNNEKFRQNTVISKDDGIE